jgi:DNA-binding MarR family transcriptional regulator
MSSDPSIVPDDTRIIQSLLQAIDAFLKLRGPIPLREFVVFLHIALDEGNEAVEYADRLKIHRGAMAKYVHDLADRARDGGPGLGLIEFKYKSPNPNNRMPIFLTKKGRSIAAAILKSLRNPYGARDVQLPDGTQEDDAA